MKKNTTPILIAIMIAGVFLAIAVWFSREVLYVTNSDFPSESIEFYIVNPPSLLRELAADASRSDTVFFVSGEAPYGEGFYFDRVETQEERDRLISTIVTSLNDSGRTGPDFDFPDGNRNKDEFYSRFDDYYVRVYGERVQVFRDRNG